MSFGNSFRNIISEEMFLEISRGNVEGYAIVHKFGSIDNVTTTLTPVATAGTYKTPTAATSLEILSSDNTNDIHPDNSAGKTGAHSVDVIGLDSNWNEITETVKLNGTTAVALTNTFLRVYRMKVTQSGSYASDTGASHNSTITLRVASAGATWATIETFGGFGLGQTQIGAYTIPTGKTGFVTNFNIRKEGGKKPNILFFVRENADDVATAFTGVMQVKQITRNIEDGNVDIKPRAPYGGFVGPADIGFLANTDTGTSDVSVDFEILLIDN